MAIYVNRVLNMKHIKAIGFDMDHTLVRYHSDVFEELTFNETIKKLVGELQYPKEVEKFEFNFLKAVRGLVVDMEYGNIMKVSLYNKIKNAYHGGRELTYKEQQRIYKGSSVDLSEDRYLSIDTAFSIAFTVVFAQLVDLKDANPNLDLPPYQEIAADVLKSVDMAHRDGSLKSQVVKDLDKYVIKDAEAVRALERFKRYGKKLWIITNSDYNYTRALLDHTITPFLKDHRHWRELFEVTVTLSAKPRFFTDKLSFLKVDPQTGLMENWDKKIETGVFQGGDAIKLQEDHGLKGDEILYLGDHIYGDILRLKKSCDWRTALVIEELDREVQAYRDTKSHSKEIDALMEKKVELEKEIDELYAKEHEFGENVPKETVMGKFDEIEKLDKQIGKEIKLYEKHFNPYWGEVMRAGAEPSVFASQIERYACIYMTQIADFNEYSPRNYYRPKKRTLAHELK